MGVSVHVKASSSENDSQFGGTCVGNMMGGVGICESHGFYSYL